MTRTAAIPRARDSRGETFPLIDKRSADLQPSSDERVIAKGQRRLWIALCALIDSTFQQAFTVSEQYCALLDRTAAAFLGTETLNEPESERM
jgi:hypothetical protein